MCSSTLPYVSIVTRPRRAARPCAGGQVVETISVSLSPLHSKPPLNELLHV